jgi:hypothetical protein
VLVLHNAVRKSRVPTVLENPGKSLNLLKRNPGLESPWKLIRSLKVLEFFFSKLEIIEELLLLPKDYCPNVYFL